MADDSQESKALRKTMGEIERILLQFVQGKLFGKVAIEVEVNQGRCIRIIQNTARSIKIDV